MPRSCSICIRSDAGTINELLTAGRSALSVAGEYGVGHRALLRHVANHLGHRSTSGATNGHAPAGAADPLDELVGVLRARALAGSDAASREYRLALAAQSAARHATVPAPDLATTAEWIEIRAKMLTALAPFPEARQALADALENS